MPSHSQIMTGLNCFAFFWAFCLMMYDSFFPPCPLYFAGFPFLESTINIVRRY